MKAKRNEMKMKIGNISEENNEIIKANNGNGIWPSKWRSEWQYRKRNINQ
jgi:hypothetical protein